MNRLRIVFVASSVGYAGAAKMLCFVAEAFAERGHNVHIINLKAAADGKVSERTVTPTVHLHDASVTGSRGVRRIQQVRKVKAIAEELNPDVLIGFTMYPNLYISVLGKLMRIPSVMSERGDPNRTFSTSIVSKMIVRMINGNTGGVFQTDGAREFYGKKLRERGVVIPNPIFLTGAVPERKAGGREKSVVSVGRLDNIQKRYDIMLRAFKQFHKEHSDYILKLYGEGSDEEKIREWVKDLGMVEAVKFMGLTSQPMQDIVNDGMFVITSDFEGISNALLEAMAVGLPCISTDHTPGGARLLIKDRENGLLAPIGDVDKLAEAMCEYVENKELAEKCGENAKRVLLEFAPDRIVDMWENYVVDLVDRAERGIFNGTVWK